MLTKSVVKKVLVPPRSKVRLKSYDTQWVHAPELKEKNLDHWKKQAETTLKRNVAALAESQELLYASGTGSLLVVLQGMDTAGKDGTIKHVMSGVNPQGCAVRSFKEPTPEELAHPFLWRYVPHVPALGRIAIFNRSYYEDVLVVRIHPEWLNREHLDLSGNALWKSRFEDINGFERHLARNGVRLLKFFLHISKEEQKKRLLARLEDETKLWKFSRSDLKERAYWSEYQKAYEHMLEETSTAWAPWYVIPADHKWAARVLVAEIMTRAIQGMKLRYPTVTNEMKKQAEAARRALQRK